MAVAATNRDTAEDLFQALRQAEAALHDLRNAIQQDQLTRDQLTATNASLRQESEELQEHLNTQGALKRQVEAEVKRLDGLRHVLHQEVDALMTLTIEAGEKLQHVITEKTATLKALGPEIVRPGAN